LAKGKENAAARLRSRLTLLFLAFALVMMIFPALAFAQDAGGSTNGSSSAPTIQSDKDDYPPGAAVTLTGSNWQSGESVHIYVNDGEGKTWDRNVDVTAGETGAIENRFDLPDWFVPVYSVNATGTRSGVATTSFTDAVQVKVQGESNPQCTGGGGNCDGGFEGGPLTGWKELNKVPIRLKFLDAGMYSVVVPFNHVSTSGDRIPGIQSLVDWSADTASGVQLDGTPQLDSSDAANWKYTVKVNATKKNALLNFNAKLAAGSHAYPGSSLDVRVENTTGVSGDVAQISKPGAGPGSPALAVTKTGPTSAAPDSTITYTLSYQNKSSAANQATGVKFTDVLPGDVTYVPGSCSNTCTVQGDEVIWNLGNLAAGQTGSQALSA
jgi:uncharacterized repeat protein (TIGR01451 family)